MTPINLGAVADKLDGSGIDMDKRLSVEALENLIKMLGQELNVTMVPGPSFQYNEGSKQFVYNRDLLLKLPGAAGAGLAFHNMGHARLSSIKGGIGDGIGKTVKDACATIAFRAGGDISAASVFNLVEAAEDERMETKLRHEYRNLGNTYLPRHDQGWRSKSFFQKFGAMQRVSKPGELDQNGNPVYWNRVATAVRGMVSGALNKELLPADMDWPQSLCDKLAELRDESSAASMISKLAPLVSDIVKYRTEAPPEEPPPGCNDGEDGDSDNGGSGNQPPPQDGIDNTDTSHQDQKGDQKNQNQKQQQDSGQGQSDSKSGQSDSSDSNDKSNEDEQDNKGNGDDSKSDKEDDKQDDQDSSGSDDEDSEDSDGNDEDDNNFVNDGNQDDENESDDDESDDGSNGDNDTEDDEDNSDEEGEEDPKESPDESEDDEEESEDQGNDEEEEEQQAPRPELQDLKDEIEQQQANEPEPEALTADDIRDEKRNNANTDYSLLNSDGGEFGAGKVNAEPNVFHGPAWSLVRQTCSIILGPIRKKIQQELKDNEIAEKERGYKSGRFDGQRYVQSLMSKAKTYYSRRTDKAERNYAFYFLVDRSGSMGLNQSDLMPVPELAYSLQEAYATYGGTYGGTLAQKQAEGNMKCSPRYQFAARLSVAFIESLARYKEVKVGIGGHNTVKPIKAFRDALTPDRKQEIMDKLFSPGGGTRVAPSLMRVLEEFKHTDAYKKMLFILTDGAFDDATSTIKGIMQKYKAEGIEVVIFTVGCDTTDARSFVDEKHVARVTDQNVGIEFGKHLRRMVKGGK